MEQQTYSCARYNMDANGEAEPPGEWKRQQQLNGRVLTPRAGLDVVNTFLESFGALLFRNSKRRSQFLPEKDVLEICKYSATSNLH